jgi:hypothetical protein
LDLTFAYELGTRRGANVKSTTLEHDPEKWKPVFRKDRAQTER